jgi:hypothetical protein
MRNKWRAWIEELLPWYSSARERQRDARTEAIRQRSISLRIRSERVLAQYRDADRRR